MEDSVGAICRVNRCCLVASLSTSFLNPAYPITGIFITSASRETCLREFVSRGPRTPKNEKALPYTYNTS